MIFLLENPLKDLAGNIYIKLLENKNKRQNAKFEKSSKLTLDKIEKIKDNALIP